MNPPVITYGPVLRPVLENLENPSDGDDRLFELVTLSEAPEQASRTVAPISLSPNNSKLRVDEPQGHPDIEGCLTSDIVFLAARVKNSCAWRDLRTFLERLHPGRYLVFSVLVGTEGGFLRGGESSGAIGAVRSRSDFVLPIGAPSFSSKGYDRPSSNDSSKQTVQLVSRIVRKLRNRLEKSPSRVEGLERILNMGHREKMRFLRICLHGLQ